MQYDHSVGVRLTTVLVVFGVALLAGVVVAVAAVRIISQGFSAREQPSAVEAVAARMMRRLAVPRRSNLTPEHLKEMQRMNPKSPTPPRHKMN